MVERLKATLDETDLMLAFEELTTRLVAGDRIDAAVLRRDYPAFAARLGCMLPAMRALASSAQDIQSPTPTGGEPHMERTLGDFRIVREIGRGGMGVVYEAEQLSIGRRVALKVLPFAAMLDSQQLNRFKLEARAAGTLDHPNIVAIYFVGCERGVHFYAMQIIEGRSLAQVVEEMRRKNGSGAEEKQGAAPLGLPTAGDTAKAALSTLRSSDSAAFFRSVAHLGVQAAEALDHAHQNGILHRDVKPANLLVDDAGKLWVTDFGLARMEADGGMTMTGDIVGTLRYMSPEQALAKRAVVDHRSDVYSLGVTLYELLTLQPAFNGGDRQQLLHQIAFEEPRKLRQVNSRIPHDLETIVLKAIEKDPADRYATSQELADDLRRFEDSKAIVARAASITHRTRKWIRRHTRLVAAAAAMLMLVSLGAVIAALLITRERRIAERNANQASANAGLALKTLDETLSEYVMGDYGRDLLGEKDKELLRRGMAFYEEYARQNDVPLNSVRTFQRLVSTYLLHEAMALEDVGRNDQADQAYRKAIQHAESFVALHDPAVADDAQWLADARYDLAIRHENYGVFLSRVGKLQQSANESMQARATFAEFHERAPQVGAYAYRLGLNHYNMGTINDLAGDTAGSETSYRAAISLLQQAIRIKDDANFRFALARAHYNLAHLFGSTARMEAAQEHWEASLSEWRFLAEMNPYVSEYASRVAATLNNLGELARLRKDLVAARGKLEEALFHQKHALHLRPVYRHACAFLHQHYETLKRVLQEQHDDIALKALGEDRTAVLTQSPDASSTEISHPTPGE